MTAPDVDAEGPGDHEGFEDGAEGFEDDGEGFEDGAEGFEDDGEGFEDGAEGSGGDAEASGDHPAPRSDLDRSGSEAGEDREGHRIIVACMGNVLRGDDGFGVEVARELEDCDLPPSVDVREVGISGVSMAQELLEGYDAMVLVDAMGRDAEPGTLFVERAEVPDLDRYGTREIGSFAADMHQTDPTKVLVLGEALGVLPDPTILVGCEPYDTDDLEDSLSDPVREAVPRAVEHVGIVVDEILASDREPEDSRDGSS